MGGFGYNYENEKIRVFFSDDRDGRTYNKVCYIETENTGHSVLGIHPGSSLDKSIEVLDKSGFKQEERNYCTNGDIYILMTSEDNIVKKIRVLE